MTIGQQNKSAILEKWENLDEVVEQYHQAAAEFIKGNPEPYKKLFSQRDDVTLANPFNSMARGWQQAKETMERASAQYRDGEIIGFENISRYVTCEIAFIVEIERFKAKIGKNQEIAPISLRTTSIFRPENNVWKIVHRHADPITAVEPGNQWSNNECWLKFGRR